MVASVKRGRPAIALRGALMVLFGIGALAQPGLPVQVLLVAFGTLLVLLGAIGIAAALDALPLHDDGWWLLVDGALMACIGLAAVAVPNAAGVAMVRLFGAWALSSGGLQLLAASRLQREARDSAGLPASAVVSIGVGSVFVWHPDAALNGMVWLLGLFAVASGGLAIYLAARTTALRRRRPAF